MIIQFKLKTKAKAGSFSIIINETSKFLLPEQSSVAFSTNKISVISIGNFREKVNLILCY